MNSRQQDRIKRTVRKSMATIQGRFDEANLGPVEVSIDWHCREVESEWGWDSIWRHPYGWYCWSDGWLIRVTVHPSSEARRQEAQVFHPNRLPAFLPLQHPASTQGAMASHSGCSQQRGRRATSDQQGLKVIYGHHAQTPPSPRKALGPSCGPCIVWSPHVLRPLTAICFPSRLSSCVWSWSPRKTTLPTNMTMYNFILSLPLSSLSLTYKMDIENTDHFYGASRNPKKNTMALSSRWCPALTYRQGELTAHVRGPNQNRKCEQSGCILLQSAIIKTGHLLFSKKPWSFHQAQFYFT